MVSAPDRIEVDEMLCFALYAASRAMTARYRPLLDAVGLTYPQFLVMVVLWDEGPATVTQIGARLRLDSGTLSPLLKRLETVGYTTRSRMPGDDRSVLIETTDKGSALRDQTDGILSEVSTSLEDVDQPSLTGTLLGLEAKLRQDT